MKSEFEVYKNFQKRWARGIKHLEDTQRKATNWFETSNVHLEHKISSDGFHIQSRIRVNSDPPYDEISLSLSDALHNFRSAFDGMAWDLAHISEENPTNPRAVQFPNLDNEKKWKQVAKDLRSVPDVYLLRISECQPFQSPGILTGIELLSLLNNRDKHRRLIECLANPGTFTVDIDTNGKTGTRNGISDGFRATFIEPEVGLFDGKVFVEFETSIPVAVLDPSPPSDIQFYVELDKRFYQLNFVATKLRSLDRLAQYVLFGSWLNVNDVE